MPAPATPPADDALDVAFRIQADAAALGFDWPDIRGPIAKVREELGEVCEALDAGDAAHAARELGDLLFAVVNLARFIPADPAGALRETCGRFTGRFNFVREEVRRQGRKMESCSLDELDAIWERAKVVAPQHPKKGG